MTSCCSVQSSSSKRLLLLLLPTPCLPSTPFQESASWPTLALSSAELWIELVFFCRFSSKNCSIHTENVAYCLFFRRMHKYIMQSEWLVGRFSTLEVIEVLTMKPMPERCPSVLGFPDQKRGYLVSCSWRLPSPGKWTLSHLTWTVHVQSELSDVQVGCCELCQAWFWCSACDFQYFYTSGSRCVPSLF